MEAQILKSMLMYFILPVWLIAGFADYLCHRATNIATTSGWKESVLHIAQLIEMGIPILALMFFEVNAGIIVLMIVCLILHEGTGWWDVAYAHERREIMPLEQHIHGFLERLPLMGFLIVIVLHWPQFLALLGLADEPARFALTPKSEPLPVVYVLTVLGCVALFEFLPYGEELLRGLKARRT
jgi:hypothetical protein